MRVALLLLLLCNSAIADPLLGSAIAMHTADWLQTREIAQNENFYENNIALGRNPSLAEVDVYMASTLLIMTTIDYLLPRKHKGSFRFLWLTAGSMTVLGNYSIGVRVKL